MPKKPKRDPSHIVFSKGRSPYFEAEEIPDTNDGRELAVGKKFIGALSRREIHWTDLALGGDPPDLVCRSADGSLIEIELAEAVDQVLRQLRHMRVHYQDALTS